MVDKPKPTKSSEDSSLFFATVSRTTLAISKVAAGAGVLGLLGFVALSVVAGVFFVTENYFVSMCALSIALLVYVTGAEVGKLFLSAFTIFFSSSTSSPTRPTCKRRWYRCETSCSSGATRRAT